MELAGLRTVGVEALSRFPAGTGSPQEWFAAAAAAGAGTSLELRALHNAVTVLPDLAGFLSLNVSPATAMTTSFTRLLGRLPLHDIVVELTEHDAVADYPALLTHLAPLRADGLRIAVDDAGAGFASMRHVLTLVPDLIKLDLSLVRGVHADAPRRALAAALTTFAAQTGALVVAEGVETADELRCLRELGVHYGQGYHLGRPVPAASLPGAGRPGCGDDQPGSAPVAPGPPPHLPRARPATDATTVRAATARRR